MSVNKELEEESKTKLSAYAKRFFSDLRSFMRDFPEFNVLGDEEEVGEPILVLCTRMSVSKYNSLPPLSSSPLSLKEILNKNLLEPMLYHTASNVLIMRAQQQERNMLTYSDGGGTKSVNDKANTYKNTYQLLRSQAEVLFKQFKVAENLNSGYGVSGNYSNYSYLNDCL